MSIFALPGLIMTVVSLAMFLAQAFAFIDAVSHRPDAYVAADVVRRLSPDLQVDPVARRITASAAGLDDMVAIGTAISSSGITIDDLGLQRPSLDDVFLRLTGHKADTDSDTEEAVA